MRPRAHLLHDEQDRATAGGTQTRLGSCRIPSRGAPSAYSTLQNLPQHNADLLEQRHHVQRGVKTSQNRLPTGGPWRTCSRRRTPRACGSSTTSCKTSSPRGPNRGGAWIPVGSDPMDPRPDTASYRRNRCAHCTCRLPVDTFSNELFTPLLSFALATEVLRLLADRPALPHQARVILRPASHEGGTWQDRSRGARRTSSLKGVLIY